jgi:hypothetical protein
MAKKIYDKNYNEEKKSFVKRYMKENCIGRCNAIHYKESKELFGLHSRQLAHVITELRIEGHPVCSHNVDGIWWAKDKEELLTTLTFLNSRISVLTSNVNGLKKALESFK